MTTSRWFTHVLPLALLAGIALVPAGCGNSDNINSYNVPKTTESSAQASAPYRLLGAIYPAGPSAWFFKFSGPTDQITKYEADFDKIITSVSIAPSATVPDFTLPEGWKRGGSREGFVKVAETIKTPDGALEITITESGGQLEANLGRWVGQIGLKSGPRDVDKYTKPFEAKGVKALRVDMRGPNNPETKRGPMMPAGHP